MDLTIMFGLRLPASKPVMQLVIFYYVEQILTIIDQWPPTYPRVILAKEFLYC